jgi:long-chain acyl-CoA synthetase
LVTGVADLLPLPLRWLAAVGLRARKAITPYALPGHLSLKKVLFDAQLQKPRPVKVQPGDLALLQYTGGTTGAAKGAMLTHLNVLANVSQGYAWLEPFLNPEADKIAVVAIPMFHIFALRLAINCMGQGGTSVLVADPRKTRAFVKVLSRHRFVFLPAVNTLFAKLLDEPAFARLDFSALRVSAGGGSPIQRSVAERWKAVTGCTLVEGYGLTECSPGVSMAPLDQAAHDGTVGLPLPSTEISLRDAAGREVALGEPGEVCVRGPQVMRGYWQRPEETAAVMTPDGFLRTGDMATMDARGALRIVDRIKELILVSGFNVYPSEVEAVALAHPGVAEAAAVSRPDAQTGEAVHLFVVRREPGLSAEAVRDHCRGQLAAYKVPRHVHCVAELPKNPIGKVLRRLLIESLTET